MSGDDGDKGVMSGDDGDKGVVSTSVEPDDNTLAITIPVPVKALITRILTNNIIKIFLVCGFIL